MEGILYLIIFLVAMYVCVKQSKSKVDNQESGFSGDKLLSIKECEDKGQTNLEPVYFDDFIGNDKVKESLKTAIKIIQQLRPVNIFLTSRAGCGKTKLTEIVANELNAHYIYRIPEQLKDYKSIIEVVNQIQETNNLTVFVVDEIHNIDRKLINIMLPILQSGRLGDVFIKPFVFIGATTDYDKVYKKSEALISRFQFRLTLGIYKISDLIKIIKNYHLELGRHKLLNESDYKEIAENSRGIPREAINLLLKRIVSNNMNEVLDQSNIIKDSITEIDVRILDTLNKSNKPIGSNALAQMSGVTQSDLENVYERYLMEKQYITRSSRGRIIADKGKRFLESMNGRREECQNDKTITAYTF